MKILSIIGILASLILMVSGYVVSKITCFISSSTGSYKSIPQDADTWGYSIFAIGIFFLVFSILGFRKK